MTRLEATYVSTSFVVLFTLSSAFSYIFQATFFSTHSSYSHKPQRRIQGCCNIQDGVLFSQSAPSWMLRQPQICTHPVNNQKSNQVLRLSIQTGCHVSIQETWKCLIANLPTILYLLDSKTTTCIKTTKVTEITLMPHTLCRTVT